MTVLVDIKLNKNRKDNAVWIFICVYYAVCLQE